MLPDLSLIIWLKGGRAGDGPSQREREDVPLTKIAIQVRELKRDGAGVNLGM